MAQVHFPETVTTSANHPWLALDTKTMKNVGFKAKNMGYKLG